MLRFRPDTSKHSWRYFYRNVRELCLLSKARVAQLALFVVLAAILWEKIRIPGFSLGSGQQDCPESINNCRRVDAVICNCLNIQCQEG